MEHLGPGGSRGDRVVEVGVDHRRVRAAVPPPAGCSWAPTLQSAGPGGGAAAGPAQVERSQQRPHMAGERQCPAGERGAAAVPGAALPPARSSIRHARCPKLTQSWNRRFIDALCVRHKCVCPRSSGFPAPRPVLTPASSVPHALFRRSQSASHAAGKRARHSGPSCSSAAGGVSVPMHAVDMGDELSHGPLLRIARCCCSGHAAV